MFCNACSLDFTSHSLSIISYETSIVHKIPWWVLCEVKLENNGKVLCFTHN